MIYKKRTRPTNLIMMESLFCRMKLKPEDKYYYFSLRKGYEKECLYDKLINGKVDDCMVFNDLTFKSGQRYFQIDSLIIQENIAFIYEIKGFSGSYFYGEEFFSSKKEYQPDNPLNQLVKTKNRLREIFKARGINLQIEGYIIFINSEFTLYNLPEIPSFILPSQIHEHIDNIQKSTCCKVKDQERIIQVLHEEHVLEYPYKELPPYTFEELKKGLYCKKCFSFDLEYGRRKYTCRKCSYQQIMIQRILEAVEEYRILFSEEKITTSQIYRWCGEEIKLDRIKYCLKKNFQAIGKNKATYYV